MTESSEFSNNEDRGVPLGKMLQKAEIEWPPGSFRHFIPNDIIKKLENKERVLEELVRIFPSKGKDTLGGYAEAIAAHARRIFAILLRSDSRNRRAICDFIDDHVTDACLPLVKIFKVPDEVERSSEYTLAKNELELGHSNRLCKAKDHTECGIKVLSTWDDEQLMSLNRDQWKAQSPVFRRIPYAVPHYEFRDTMILPFTEDGEKTDLMFGGYSEVWPIRIHPAHQDILISAATPVWLTIMEIK